MTWIVAFAAKSLLIAGGTLLLLQLAAKRSAADRSWIAHLGLVALMLLPVASWGLPALEVAGPAFLAGEAQAPTAADPATAVTAAAPAPEVASTAKPFPVEQPAVATAVDWRAWGLGIYLVPAGLLFLLTLIAVGRLVALKARSQVLVEPHWLTALARAQRRMGFKHGTALLTSDELRSPVSWGMMRPVIVLNTEAADAHGEAEAIIAHELAHVARLDWVKLILARVVTALYWFNPLVWLLAREAHQLREEAADDAVLGSDIEDTDYARLLVGIARHECRGLLLGAHGVAPAKNSLARRVRRVLDRALTRAPGGWRWTSAAAFFAAGMAVPVAALNFVPTTPVAPAAAVRTSTGGVARSVAPVPSTAPTVAIAAIAAPKPAPATDSDEDYDVDVDVDVDVDPDVALDAADRAKIAQAVAVARTVSADASARALVRARSRSDRAMDEIVSAKIHGVTPEYARSIRSASGSLARLSMDELVGFKIHRVSPELIRELGRIGGGKLTVDQVTSAAVHGVTPAYAREMHAAGYARTVNELIDLKVFNITPEWAERFRRAGYRNLTAKQMIKFRNLGVQPDDLRGVDSP